MNTITEVASRCRASEKSVRGWISTDKVKAVRLPNNRIRISDEELERLLSVQTEPAEAVTK